MIYPIVGAGDSPAALSEDIFVGWTHLYVDTAEGVVQLDLPAPATLKSCVGGLFVHMVGWSPVAGNLPITIHPHPAQIVNGGAPGADVRLPAEGGPVRVWCIRCDGNGSNIVVTPADAWPFGDTPSPLA